MASPAFDPALPYEIHPQVAIRPEPFGGLAYNYENRRLTLITAQPLVEIVNSLDAHATADDAIAATVEAARTGPLFGCPRHPSRLGSHPCPLRPRPARASALSPTGSRRDSRRRSASRGS